MRVKRKKKKSRKMHMINEKQTKSINGIQINPPKSIECVIYGARVFATNK